MTRAGLLRYFAVALTLNDPAVPEYQLAGWHGLSRLPSVPASRVLEPGGFEIFRRPGPALRPPQGTELYHLYVDGQGGFRIVPAGGNLESPHGFHPARDFFLLLNLGFGPVSVLR